MQIELTPEELRTLDIVFTCFITDELIKMKTFSASDRAYIAELKAIRAKLENAKQ